MDPFLGEYYASIDVEIYSGATELTLEHIELFILVFGPVLWFESQMERTFVNPCYLVWRDEEKMEVGCSVFC